MTDPTPPDLTALTDRLAGAAGNLDAYIAAAAEPIAALQGEYEGRLRRAADLKTELRRQLDAPAAPRSQVAVGCPLPPGQAPCPGPRRPART